MKLETRFDLGDSVQIPDTKVNRFTLSSPERYAIGETRVVACISVCEHSAVNYMLCAEGKQCVWVAERFLVAMPTIGVG